MDDKLPSPLEFSRELMDCFTEIQAETIAAEVYQPLMLKVEAIETTLIRLDSVVLKKTDTGSDPSKSREEALEKALRDIMLHQELIGGSLGRNGAVYAIAEKALK